MRRLPALLWICVAWAGAGAGEEAFRGRIVDADGRPLAGVELSPLWLFPDRTLGATKIEPAEDQPTATTDDEGFFVLDRETPGQRDWLALDAARAHGALVSTAGAGGDAVPAFALEPLVEVRGSYAIEAAGSVPESIGTWARRRLGRNPVAFCKAWSERFALELPPEEYSLLYSNGDLNHRSTMSLSKRIEIAPGDPPVDLGEIRLKLPRVIEVSGRVLDAGGNPVVGAEVARFWIGDGAEMQGLVSHTTGEDGSFVGREPVRAGEFPLMAMDRERRLGGLVHVLPDRRGPITIRMGPLVEVKGRMKIKGGKAPPRWSHVSISTRKGGLKIARSARADGSFSAKLPPGEYVFLYSGADAKPRVERVDLDSGKETLDLGKIALKPNLLSRKAGRPAPALNVTGARGLPGTIDLEQLRGKWVAVEFWGHWCGPCVRDSLPRLARLYRKYAGKRDRFEILALHDTTAKSFDELDEYTEEIVAELWNGQPLPFPVLLDSTGKTIERYGIVGYPTLVLIDPQGRLVAGGSEQRLEEILQGL